MMSFPVLLVLLSVGLSSGAEIRRGVAVLRASAYYKSVYPGADVLGTVTFEQANVDGPVVVSVEASGLNKTASELGFHVHQHV